jgi:hypothetical protein
MVTKCGDCRFWDGCSGFGGCHRHAPIVDKNDNNGCGKWPMTFSHWWCGDGESNQESEATLVSVNLKDYVNTQ